MRYKYHTCSILLYLKLAQYANLSYYAPMAKDTNFNPLDIMKMLNTLIQQGCALHFTYHAQQRMQQRGIIYLDIRHLLLHGDCALEREQAESPNNTDEVFWKYKIYGKTPNTGNRKITALTIIPSEKGGIKLVTVYWND